MSTAPAVAATTLTAAPIGAYSTYYDRAPLVSSSVLYDRAAPLYSSSVLLDRAPLAAAPLTRYVSSSLAPQPLVNYTRDPLLVEENRRLLSEITLLKEELARVRADTMSGDLVALQRNLLAQKDDEIKNLSDLVRAYKDQANILYQHVQADLATRDLYVRDPAYTYPITPDYLPGTGLATGAGYDLALTDRLERLRQLRLQTDLMTSNLGRVPASPLPPLLK